MNLIDVLLFFVLIPLCVVYLVYRVARFSGGFRSQLSTLRADDIDATVPTDDGEG